MISFFRRVRQNLLIDNKVGRYMKYAIGEIFLVVFGILIALQIESTYQDHLQSKKESSYLINLRLDLEDQIETINDQIDFESRFQNAGKRLLSLYDSRNSFEASSSFYKDFETLANRKTFTRIDATYTDLTSSGKIDLIKNVDLKQKVVDLYQNLERFEIIINKNNSIYVDDQFIPLAQKLGNFSGLFISDEAAIRAYEHGMDTTTFKASKNLIAISNESINRKENELLLYNSITFRYLLAMAHHSYALDLKNQTQATLDLIKKELNKD